MLSRVLSKGNTAELLVGVKTCIATLEISVVVPQELGNRSAQDPAIPLLGIFPKNSTFYYRDTCSFMFIAALFIVTRNW